MIYPEEGIAVSTGTAWGDSIVDNSSNWNTAYNNSIVSAEVTGTTTKTLTLDQQDGGTITASWTDYDTAPVTSVFGRTGAVVAVSGDYTTAQVTESGNLYFTDARARLAISLTTLGTSGAATYNNTTGVLNIPNYTTDLTGYVPYTGATTNVNLGVHSLIAYDLIINHTSGSGVAASITKGGNGEALTVVKSSGSGNAASITGGVTLLSELHLTTDLADAYIASAATWNAKQNAITLTTTGTSGAATFIGSTLNIPNYQAALTNPVTGTGSSGYVSFWDSSSSITGESNLFWDSSNNRLGIGTISPLAFLDVAMVSSGTRRLLVNYADSIVTIKSANDANNGENLRLVGDNIFFNTGSSGNGTQRMTITSAGNVGIGVTPTATAGVTELAIGSSNTNPRLSGIRDGVDAFYLYSDSGGTLLNERRDLDLKLGTNNTTRLTIANNGASTFTSTLQAAGITSSNSLNQFTAIYSIDPTYYTYYRNNGIYFYGTDQIYRIEAQGNTTSLMRIHSNGNIVIGDNVDAGFKLDVNGTTRIRGAATFSSSVTSLAASGTGVIIAEGTATNGEGLVSVRGKNSSGTSRRADFKYDNADVVRIATASPINMQFETNDIIRMTITSGGNVGIGVTPFANTLSKSLDLVNGGGLFAASNNYYVTANAYFDSSWKYKATSGAAFININSGGDGSIGFVNAASGSAGSTISFTEKMKITSGGNVLIGTTGISGGGTLQVSGNVNINGVFQINGVTIGGGGGSGVTGSGTTDFLTKWTGSTTLGNSLISDNGSTVSVRSGAIFQVNRTDNGRALQLYTTNDECVINSWEASSEPLHIRSMGSGGRIQFFTASTERMRIFSNGNVSINSTTSGERFQVNGSIKTTGRTVLDTGVGGLTLSYESGIGYINTWNSSPLVTSTYGYISWDTNGSERMRIVAANGNLLIGTTTDNGYKVNLNGSISYAYGFLSIFRGSSGAGDIFVGNDGSRIYIGGNTYVAGNVTATGGFFDTSDARLKTLLEDNYLLSSIASVKARLYIKDGRKELGYYAQDLEAILPSAVKEGSDGFLSLSYAQVHTAKIAVIEDEVTILKNRVNELETKLKKYEA
jgi:hypothetical protein